MKNLLPIYYQTAGIYYRPVLAASRLANLLLICYRQRRICYKSIHWAPESSEKFAFISVLSG